MSGGGAANTATGQPYLSAAHASLLMMTDVSPGAGPFTDYCLITDLENARSDHGGNPYSGVDAYDADDLFDEAELKIDALSTAITALSYSTDWKNILSAADSKLSTLDEIDTIDDIDIGTVSVSGISVSSVTPGIVSVMQIAISAIVEPEVMDEVEAIEVDDIVVGSALTAYTARQLPNLNQSVVRLKSLLSDSNATDGNSFMVGVANIEAQYNREVSAANIDITWKKALAEFDASLQLALGRINALLQNQQVQADLRKQTRELELRADATYVEAYTQAEIANKRLVAEADMAKQRIEAEADLQTQKLLFDEGSERRRIKADAEVRIRQLNVMILTTNLSTKSGFLLDSSRIMAALLQNKTGLQQNLADIYVKYFSSRVIADQEESNRNIELDVNESLWDVHLYQHASNFLGGVSGGQSAPLTNGMSKPQSVLSGAAAGASLGNQIGTAVPGIGNAVGTGVGAAVGAIAGLF
jgi:hypothetical protein